MVICIKRPDEKKKKRVNKLNYLSLLLKKKHRFRVLLTNIMLF